MAYAVGEKTNFLSWRSQTSPPDWNLRTSVSMQHLFRTFFRSQAAKAVKSRSGNNPHFARWGTVTFAQATNSHKRQKANTPLPILTVKHILWSRKTLRFHS